MNDNELMKTMPVPQAVAKMAIPSIISSLVTVVYNMADTFFVGQTGDPLQVAAVSLTNPIFILFMAFANMFGMGGSAAASIAMGENNKKRMKQVSAFITYASLGIGIVFAALLVLFMQPILGIFGANAETYDLAKGYVFHISYGAPFIIWSAAASFVVRSEGSSREAMIGSMIGTVANIVLDPIMISGLHMGAAGAAIATVSAQALSVIFAIILLIKKTLPFTITRHDFRFNTQCPKFLSIGLPLALQEFLTQLSFLALCAFVNRLGLEASSGYGVACKIVNFAMLVPSALMQSMASFVSQNVGAGKVKRARHTLFTGIGVGLCVGCIVFTLVLLKGDVLSGFFSTDAAVIQNSYDYLKGFALESIVTAVLFSMIGYFNGNNQTLWVMTQGLIQTLLVRLPLAYFMSIQPDASLTKIGLAAPVSTIVGIVLNIGYYIYWTRKQQHPPVEEII